MTPHRPVRLRVEASTACNLRCPSCPTARGLIGRGIGTGFLDPADFARLLDGAPWVREVELSNWGEIFLNPRLEEVLAIAHARGVALYADNGVHFNRVGASTLESLVRYQVRSMKVSIDGATPATYALYRRGGDLDEVLANVRRLIALRESAGSPYPRLKWQFVLFEHNRHEVEAARALAGSLGMKFKVKLDWDTRPDGPDGLPHNQRMICGQLWREPQVNWDGRVLGCCVNHWGDFGNAFSSGLAAVLDGERLAHARRMLSGRAGARDDVPCTSCKHYRAVARTGRWMPE